jgi:hypothetical protein
LLWQAVAVYSKLQDSFTFTNLNYIFPQAVWTEKKTLDKATDVAGFYLGPKKVITWELSIIRFLAKISEFRY